MRATLYSLTLSHPSMAARAMLERKGIEHRVIDLLPGFQAVQLRLAGFRGGTVPALRLDGRRVQRSLEICRALERLQPEPALFPDDPERRDAVEEAERWGEGVLQDVPRRIFRWGAWRKTELRRWIAEDVGLPLPRVAARVNAPVAWRLARASGASDAGARADVESLPALLDRVDALIAEGTIGGEEPNAADFQILSSVRVLLSFPDLRFAVEGRPCAPLAMRHFPDYPGPIPGFLPAEWLASLESAAVA